jgi:hypothetical protein
LCIQATQFVSFLWRPDDGDHAQSILAIS